MKVRLLVICCFIFLITCSIVFAEKDLSTGIGDFDTINLGDSKIVVMQRIEELNANRYIRYLHSTTDNFFNIGQYSGKVKFIFDDISFYLTIREDILSKISFSFYNSESKNIEIIEKIKPFLIKKYGEPMESKEYPNIITKEDYTLCGWNFDNYKKVQLKLTSHGVVIEIKKTQLPSEIKLQQEQEEAKRKQEEREKAYSQVKGDFKVLCLGDTKEVIEDKLNFLKEQNQISVIYSQKSFGATLLDQYIYVYPSYFQNKLYRLFITFPYYNAQALDYKIKDFVLKELKPMFVKLYSKPTNDYDYPTILQMSDNRYQYVSRWILQQKTVIIGVIENDFEYAAIIDITDNRLLADKKKDDEIQKNKSINKSTENFK